MPPVDPKTPAPRLRCTTSSGSPRHEGRARKLPANDHGRPVTVPTLLDASGSEAFEKGLPGWSVCSDESDPSLDGPQSAPLHSADPGPRRALLGRRSVA
jgi:hypothetical protein